MKTVPTGDFAVVEDIERKMIVDCGTFGQCQDRAYELNYAYQSDAYVAKLWVIRHVQTEPCQFTFAHTREWCGNPNCRES